MTCEPYLFCHDRPRWKEGTDPVLVAARTINEEPAKSKLSSLTINVSDAECLLAWLDKNDASFITHLHVLVEAYIDRTKPPLPLWQRLFRKLALEANNLRDLDIYWDHDSFMHPGLGDNESFVQAVSQLNVQETLTLNGLYAKEWPAYLESKIGLRPRQKSRENIVWAGMLWKYQKARRDLLQGL